MPSYDLSTSSKWAALSSQAHTVKIRAKGTGYSDSPFSNEVTVTKGSTGETWVLNETLNNTSITADIIFSSNDIQMKRLYRNYDASLEENQMEYTANQSVPVPDKYPVYDGGMWYNQAYRTITFQTPPTGDLLTWLQANGTKQGGAVTEHTLTFNGEITVTVDGASVTSPYTLTRDCTIVLKCGRPMTVNGENVPDGFTKSLSNVDITCHTYGTPSIGYEETITIKYTA